MRLYTVNAGYFKLDGGAMFGVVPKSMWYKANPCDDNNMCSWAMRCLLVDTGDSDAIVRGDDAVIRLPRHAARDVRQFRVEFGRLIALDFPRERWLENRVVAQRRKNRLPRQREAQLAIDFDDWFAAASVHIGLLTVRSVSRSLR